MGGLPTLPARWSPHSRGGRHRARPRAATSPAPPRCDPSARRSTAVLSRPAGRGHGAGRGVGGGKWLGPGHTQRGRLYPPTKTGIWQCLDHLGNCQHSHPGCCCFFFFLKVTIIIFINQQNTYWYFKRIFLQMRTN